jgi:hypothetical protein
LIGGEVVDEHCIARHELNPVPTTNDE